MKKMLKIVGLLLVALGGGYVFGPTVKFAPVTPETPTLPADLPQLEQEIARTEVAAQLKPDNEARIVWADSTHKQKTPYSLVYIPGFGASWAEGDPIHRQLAKRFGCNLYLARTEQHGVKSAEAMKTLTPDNYAASAERALAIGKAIGDKVVVMGTSAGGMLTLYLATHHPDLHGLILYSPCIAIANPAMKLTTKPWGRQILDKVMNGEYVTINTYQPDRAQYWLTRYHNNGLLTLQTMMDQYMTADQFATVKQPLFLGYYFKDEAHQDKVVSVPAMLRMFDEVSTPAAQKEKVAFANAGEHVIASHFTSGDLPGVYAATEAYMKRVLNMTPVAPASGNLAINQK